MPRSRTEKEILVPLSVKVPPDIDAEVKAIAEKRDRPVGYIARKLMVRGLLLYRDDKSLDGQNGKETNEYERPVITARTEAKRPPKRKSS